MKKKISKNKLSIWLTALAFLLPALVLWLIWFFIPVIESFRLSFFQFNYVMPVGNHFLGFKNYTRLFHDSTFKDAFVHSLKIVFFAVPIQTAISLVMALVINVKFKGRGIFRTIFYAPYVLSSIAIATVFMYLFAQKQLLTHFFAFFGMEDVAWAVNIRYALPLIIIMYIWQQVGFYMVIFLSGLQTIPGEVLESSQIDGANSIQTFRYITLPTLKPTTFLVLTYGVISSFQIFDQISAVAGTGVLGSPGGSLNTLVTFFYVNAFKYGDVGYGSSAAVLLFIIILGVTLLQKKLMDRE